MKKKLKKDFYIRNVLVVARELLGKIFVVVDENTGEKLSGKIVETEAYDGNMDEAAHTFNGKTDRNKIMFEDGGSLYVYFTYGIHFCANIVTGTKNHGAAVLLRGIEPIDGIEVFAERRFGKTDISDKERINLLNGPAKICQAFGLNRTQNGSNLLGDKIYLLEAHKIAETEIISAKRIGIKKSAELPWRFYIKNNLNVSRK